ncbi:DUF6282 family protein [Dethiosulfatarculus sandiegensis]|uniref:Cytosolic protein n=1 Tax=Dethiosulfatarculus sandiegensis TaxID=1429043 RepID=A0A0D2JSW6_9BACT|nr:DUF6282 family protein [Dethiosulfatarculus sandiegensis]KIX12550.1 hypothetical protein X474_18270 [Dethiosulfatarculus sandiegensis]
MPLVNLEGAFDLHIHTNPSLIQRSKGDLETARDGAESPLAGIMLKNHFESTVGRAATASQAVEGIQVYGGLVLNTFCGGLNPAAVDTAIKLGARQIWMPTLSSRAHKDKFPVQGSSQGAKDKGISVLTEDNKLKPEVKTILELCRESGVILGTAHLTPAEIYELARLARTTGFKKLLVTHPYFAPPRLSVKQQKELTSLGARLELCGGNLYPIPGLATLDNYLETISAIGAQNLILSSDAGQPRKSKPYEVLRVFAQCLVEKGIKQEDIDLMTKKVPAELLGD